MFQDEGSNQEGERGLSAFNQKMVRAILIQSKVAGQGLGITP